MAESEIQEIVEFETVKENWNLYKLRDGTLVKTKFILIKIRKPTGFDEMGNPLYGINSTNVIGVITPKKLMGPPSPPVTPKDLASSIVEDDIEFETIKEDWNQYSLKDGTILNVKLTLVKVSRTNKFDAGGDPIYIVNTQPIIKPKLPKKELGTADKGHITFVT